MGVEPKVGVLYPKDLGKNHEIYGHEKIEVMEDGMVNPTV